MKQTLFGVLLASLCCAGFAQSTDTTPPAVAKQQAKEIARGEPARWQKADNTTQAQMATKRKEIKAALNEAMVECKQMASTERSECQREARATYQEDMANVRELVTASNQMGSAYETSGR
ncbi:hypothetical protein [Massilia endophytica]|uniref:hypothetical protein n=1 Tax=Massilia endophytica TaxID=2899220 RepID=UPI001E34F816|nr:hypothetical protein [Massilia endophytica]UGQ47860.1 hypothetical protein LSQ66_05160 [Massilia endophytica]